MGVVDQSTENKTGSRGHMCAHVSAEARIQIKKTTGDQRGGQGEKLILNSDQVTTSLCQNPHDSDPFFLKTAAQKLSEIQLAQRSAFERSETEAQVF